MRRRLLSALLVMAMALTMLPVSAFADGTPPAVEDYSDFVVGYLSDRDNIVAATGLELNNTLPYTIFVKFEEAPPESILWAEIEVPGVTDNKLGIVFGCDGNSNTFSFSLANRGQFEYWPDSLANDSVKPVDPSNGDNLVEGNYKVTVYQLKAMPDSNLAALPTEKTQIGETQTVSVAKEDPEGKLTVTLATGEVLGKDMSVLEGVKIGEQNGDTIALTGTPLVVTEDEKWEDFSSVSEQQTGRYIALTLSDNLYRTIKITSPSEGNIKKVVYNGGILITRIENFEALDYINTIEVGEETVKLDMSALVAERTVTFDPNGGKFEDGSSANKTVKVTNGNKLTAGQIPANLTKEGFTFKGWALSTDSETVIDDLTKEAVTADATYQAVWEAENAEEFDVTFDPKGGKFEDDSSANKTVKVTNGGKLTAEQIPANLTKEGFTFKGWALSTASETVIDDLTKEVVTANTTYQAVWEEKNAEKFDVTFDPNGGKFAAEVTAKVNTANLTDEQLETIGEPTREGYQFLGWAKTADASVSETVTGPVTAATTLYAVWIKNAEEGKIQAGFSWNGDEANKAMNAAIVSAGKDKIISDSLDQAYWFLINDDVTVADSKYYYEISLSGQQEPIQKGVYTGGQAGQVGLIYCSFLMNLADKEDEANHNPKDLVVKEGDKLTFQVYKGEDKSGEALEPVEVTVPANPLKIESVEVTGEKTVAVKFNDSLYGRYIVELKKGDIVVASQSFECDRSAPDAGIQKAEGVVLTAEETLVEGNYTVNLYTKKSASEQANGAAVVTDNSLKLYKVVFMNGETKAQESIVAAGAQVTPPEVEVPSGNSFNGWKNGEKAVDLTEGKYVVAEADATDNVITLIADFAKGLIDPEYVRVVALDEAGEQIVTSVLSAEIVKAENGDQTIVISGLASDQTASIGLAYYLDVEDAELESKVIEIAISADGKAFELKAGSESITTSSDVTYAIDVTKLTVSKTEVVDPTPVVDTENLTDADGKPLDEADVAAVAAAVQYSNIENIAQLIVENADEINNTAASVTDAQKDAAKTELGELENVAIGEEDEIIIVTQPIMQVEAQTYDKENGVLTVDVSAAYRMVAIKADLDATICVSTDEGVDPNDANAVVVGEVKKMEVNTSVTFNVGLPDALAEDAEGNAIASIPVKHEKNGAHYHEADVFKDEHGYYAAITSEDGLSPFTFEANANLVAEVNGKKYDSLANAINAAADGDTVTLLAALTGDDAKATVTFDADKNITFKLAEGVAETTITVNDTPITVPTGATGVTQQFKKPSSGNNSNPGFVGGGASGTTTYSVNVPTVEHGTVTVNPRNAAKDATVTITVSPNQGYSLGTLTVTDKDGNNVELTKVENNKYTFKMPASRVEIKATFVEGEAPATTFTDVQAGEYYYDAVLWAVDKGITTGLTETTFGPNASCTRAQMVTFLWRAAGSPEPTGTANFTDIDANEYYYKAVLWAVEKGITTGTTETTFSPNATVTRGQTVTFLYRYAGSPAAQGNNAFTDVEASEYYANAVTWAAANGITTGTTSSTFSPANNCTRGQIVTFLYRQMVK